MRLSDFSTKIFAATRADGLGGRLLAMVNAKSLADRMGCRFGFTWNGLSVERMEFHAVERVDKVFSADFVEKHWLGESVDATGFAILDGAFTRDSLEADARRIGLRG